MKLEEAIEMLAAVKVCPVETCRDPQCMQGRAIQTVVAHHHAQPKRPDEDPWLLKYSRDDAREKCALAAQYLRKIAEHHAAVPATKHDLEVAVRLLTKDNPPTYDLVLHLIRQKEFSEKTFGPGDRWKGVIAHIRKELIEIEKAPQDLEEWIDVVLLGFDGAWRTGASPERIAKALEAKQTKNEARKWPDWRKASADTAIEHDRSEEIKENG